MSQSLAEYAGSKLKKPAGDDEMVTEENSLLDGEETDQPESRIKRNVKKMAQKMKEGKKSAARGIRDEIKGNNGGRRQGGGCCHEQPGAATAARRLGRQPDSLAALRRQYPRPTTTTSLTS